MSEVIYPLVDITSMSCESLVFTVQLISFHGHCSCCFQRQDNFCLHDMPVFTLSNNICLVDRRSIKKVCRLCSVDYQSTTIVFCKTSLLV